MHPQQTEVVVTQTQFRQRHALGQPFVAFDARGFERRQFRHPKPVMLQLAVFPFDLDLHRRAVAAGRDVHAEMIQVLANHQSRIDRLTPSRGFAGGQSALDFLGAPGGKSQ